MTAGAIAGPMIQAVNSFGVKTSIAIVARSHRLMNIAATSIRRTGLLRCDNLAHPLDGRRSVRAPAPFDERVEHPAVDLDAVAQQAFARAEGAFRGDADLVDTGLARRRLHAVDQLRHASLEDVGRSDQVRPERDEEI